MDGIVRERIFQISFKRRGSTLSVGAALLVPHTDMADPGYGCQVDTAFGVADEWAPASEYDNWLAA